MPWKINTIIAEDDNLVLDYITGLLGGFEELNLLGRARSGQELLEMVDSLHPLLIFMDIELPDINGLEAARRIKQAYPDIVIAFLTGHTEYAVQAFELDACDYLVKPVIADDIARVVQRCKKRMPPAGALPVRGDKLAGERLIVRSGPETYILDPGRILFVEKVQRHTVIVTADKSYKSSESLDALASRMDERFVRCHRGFIVNSARVEKIEPVSETSYEASFYQHEGRALVSRSKLQELVARLESQ